MESRKYFVQQVTKTILENHSKDKSSFIFGISGKWGEGKTYFLDDLEIELKNKDNLIKVYRVNPWKFTSDKVSFMRDFLKSLDIKLSWAKSDFGAWVEHFIDWVKGEGNIKDLEFDKTRNQINWSLVFKIFIAIGLIIFCYYKWPNYIQLAIDWIKSLPDVKWLITALLLPIFASFFPQLITTQKSSQAVSTIEQFDHFLNKIIKKSTWEKNKIIVFVDDLDRVTPEIAREVLDNLRTFFDKPKISFIVTGDHTILERHLGSELLPEGKPSEKLEEGRRFLKKIFNVYWRLPLPITNEVREFIKSNIVERKETLSEFFKDNETEELEKYLEKYFEKNFRHIIRFLDTIVFTLQVIKLRKELDDLNKCYFEEILKYPLLVIRVLMFQELCAPFFEKICEEPGLLGQMEYAAETKSTEKINTILNNFGEDMSPSQRGFISKFVYEEPRFYNGKSLRVSSIEPFLFLAADASLGDQRGPSSEDFLATVDSGDPEQVKNSIISMGDEKAKKCIDEFKKRINSTADINLKDISIKTLSASFSNMSELFQAQNIFLNGLGDIDFSFYEQLSSLQKCFVLNNLWSALDLCDDESILQKFSSLFAYKKIADINEFTSNPIKSWGKFSTRQMIQWIKNYYPQENNDSINKLYLILPKMKEFGQAEIIEKEIGLFKQTLIDKINNDTNADIRLKTYEIIKYSKESSSEFKKQMLTFIENKNESIYNWIISLNTSTDIENPIITNKDIQDKILIMIQKSQDKSSFLSNLSFSVNKIPDKISKLWDILLGEQVNNLLDSIVDILSNSNYQKILPSNPKKISEIFNLFVNHISAQDDQQIINYINYLRKDHWFWVNIGDIDVKIFEKFNENTKEEETIKQIDLLRNTWAVSVLNENDDIKE